MDGWMDGGWMADRWGSSLHNSVAIWWNFLTLHLSPLFFCACNRWPTYGTYLTSQVLFCNKYIHRREGERRESPRGRRYPSSFRLPSSSADQKLGRNSKLTRREWTHYGTFLELLPLQKTAIWISHKPGLVKNLPAVGRRLIQKLKDRDLEDKKRSPSYIFWRLKKVQVLRLTSTKK